MTQVYLLITYDFYQDTEIDSVYSSKAEAKRYAEHLAERDYPGIPREWDKYDYLVLSDERYRTLSRVYTRNVRKTGYTELHAQKGKQL